MVKRVCNCVSVGSMDDVLIGLDFTYWYSKNSFNYHLILLQIKCCFCKSMTFFFFLTKPVHRFLYTANPVGRVPSLRVLQSLGCLASSERPPLAKVHITERQLKWVKRKPPLRIYQSFCRLWFHFHYCIMLINILQIGLSLSPCDLYIIILFCLKQ